MVFVFINISVLSLTLFNVFLTREHLAFIDTCRRDSETIPKSFLKSLFFFFPEICSLRQISRVYRKSSSLNEIMHPLFASLGHCEH